jgi:Asp-tRNA(Asn)/Glu-tRNA(Gln) amidotransferase A subunit family amidase
MDVEDPSHREALKSACDNLKQAGVEVYLSHPNIEVWLLSHFEQTARPFADSNAVKACLKARWKKEFGSEYDETLLDIFRRLKDRTAKAINNARAVREKHHKGKKMFDANSSTEVYLLMSNLDVLGTADADKTPPRWNPPSCR